MTNYRWIEYPPDLPADKKARYEEIADMLVKQAIQPVCIVWAAEDEDWIDDNGVNPPRNCLLMTEHVEQNGWATFGNNLLSVVVHG